MEGNDKKILLQIRDLKQYFPVGKGEFVRANDGISLDIYEGETFGLVGESGCGKSTLGRTILQLYRQTGGRTLYFGRSIDEMAPRYVYDTFRGLTRRRRDLERKREKLDAFRAEYDRQTEQARYAMNDELTRLEKEVRDAMLDAATLIGGLFAAPNLKRVEALLLRRYRLRDGDPLRESIDRELDELRARCREEPDYAEFESCRSTGIDLTRLTPSELREIRSDLQMIFQDPYSSLNPRMTVGQIIGEGLIAHKFFRRGDARMKDEITRVMAECGLSPWFLHRYPHQFSGGQRQRIGIARSLALRPKFVVCDEAVSALDVSIQAQIINLLRDLKEKERLTYLFITHDLSVVKYISDRIGVMYLGHMMETAASEELFAHPMHPYTRALLNAIPTTDETRSEPEILEGDIPSPVHPPAGCKFHTRCKYCTEICTRVVPEFLEVRPGHFAACHHVLEISEG